MPTSTPATPKPRKIIGISMSPAPASKLKAEAGRRQIRLKQSFEEMWELHEKHGRNQKS